MKKTSLDLNHLEVESFEAMPNMVSLGLAKGTACFELCAADPTSNPDVETCGAHACP